MTPSETWARKDGRTAIVWDYSSLHATGVHPPRRAKVKRWQVSRRVRSLLALPFHKEQRPTHN